MAKMVAIEVTDNQGISGGFDISILRQPIGRKHWITKVVEYTNDEVIEPSVFG